MSDDDMQMGNLGDGSDNEVQEEKENNLGDIIRDFSMSLDNNTNCYVITMPKSHLNLVQLDSHEELSLRREQAKKATQMKEMESILKSQKNESILLKNTLENYHVNAEEFMEKEIGVENQMESSGPKKCIDNLERKIKIIRNIHKIENYYKEEEKVEEKPMSLKDQMLDELAKRIQDTVKNYRPEDKKFVYQHVKEIFRNKGREDEFKQMPRFAFLYSE